MYPYKVEPFYESDKVFIVFFHTNNDGFRAALSAVFEPLGYVSEYEAGYFYITPGPAVPEERNVRVGSDEWGIVLCESHSFGDTASNHKWIAWADDLLQKSGAFVKVTGADEEVTA